MELWRLVSSTYQLLRIVVPSAIVTEIIGPDELPAGWQNNTLVTREIGDRWLDQSESAVLQVPSAISHQGRNFLLNPVHPDAAKIVVAEIIHAPLDSRLLK
jgi:RES domain-containing protein